MATVEKKEKTKKRKKEQTNEHKIGIIKEQTLPDITEYFSKIYGTEVVEERAIPDFRDGLKPVHRALLWAMYQQGAHYKAKYRKAARVIGDAMGKYHPHGDMALFGALVTITNTLPNLVDGQGNWGDPTSGAAAPRYVECRLSEFSDKFILDKDYLAVVPKIKNYDGTEEWPLFLPAKLPVQLLVGSPTVPAYGVSAGTPPFHIKGVVELVIRCLKGEEITAKLCAQHLVPHYPYGGECVSSRKELAEFCKTGKGSLQFIPEIEVDNNLLRITSCAPGFMTANGIETKLGKIAELPTVKSVEDVSSSKSGKYGIEFRVEAKKGQDFDETADKIRKILGSKEAYHIGYTHRKRESTRFGRTSVVGFLQMWVKYRIALEANVIKHLITEQEKILARLELLVFAVDNRKIILEALNSKDPDAYLVKALKKPEEYVKQLLDLKVRQLAALNKERLLKEIKEVKAKIKDLQSDLKAPAPRVVKQLEHDMKSYLKTTKDCIECISRE